MLAMQVDNLHSDWRFDERNTSDRSLLALEATGCDDRRGRASLQLSCHLGKHRCALHRAETVSQFKDTAGKVWTGSERVAGIESTNGGIMRRQERNKSDGKEGP